MRFLSFFAGIGGFDIGLERAGHVCVGQIETDRFARTILERHWPNVPKFGNVRTLDADALPDAELWCGGFPCQPFSAAGRKDATDDVQRDLWPAWHRLISVRRPAWVFAENVPGLLSADGGKAFGRVIRDLAALRYVGEWTVLSAGDVGAPHRRERLWIVAHLADADGRRCEVQRIAEHGGERCEPRGIADGRGAAGRRPGPWDSDPADAAAESRLGRMADGVPNRTHRLRCLGNAVVPQVVEAIARKVWG